MPQAVLARAACRVGVENRAEQNLLPVGVAIILDHPDHAELMSIVRAQS